VRAGEVPLDDIVAQLDDVTGLLEQLTAESALPPRADQASVDRFLVAAYERAWSR